MDIVLRWILVADCRGSFFLVVGSVAMIMCFFILFLSFTANVQENAWEFAVLRALGIAGFNVVMIYVYESLAIVLAGTVLGAAIGLLVAITLTLQFNMFVEMPFNFQFPWAVFWGLFSLALVVSVIASAWPAWSVKRKTITSVLRRQ